MKRWPIVVCSVALGALAALLVPGTAAAHPLGNFSVNQLHALTLAPDRVDVAAVVDAAELPTLQERSTVDTTGSAGCASLARDFAVTVDGRRLSWTVVRHAFAYQEGTGGLPTSRLSCGLSATATLDRPATVEVDNGLHTDRVGWRELTAVGAGVRLDSPLPARSVSADLTAYPEDLLSSPLDVRRARLLVAPGAGPAAEATTDGRSTGAATTDGRSTGAATTPGWLAGAESTLRGWMATRQVTPLLGVLAVLLAAALGAGHALLPGHGKTVMAAYLAGRNGRPRDAVVVGATVTLTHTGGVLVLGLLLTTAAGLVGEAVLGWLGLVSGVIVAAVGVGMLRGLRRRHSHDQHGHQHHDHASGHGHVHGHGPEHASGHGHGPEHASGHSHVHGHGPEHASGHGHGPVPDHSPQHGPSPEQNHGSEQEHGAEHDQGPAPGHDGRDHGAEHDHGPTPDHSPEHGHGAERDHDPAHDHDGRGHVHHHHQRPGRLSLVGMGVAGGLVPSPSALVVLLGAVALGRTAFGVLLVIAYGLGMAAVLTAAGLLLLRLRDRWPARLRPGRLSRLAPAGTAALVLLVGVGLAGRALVTL